MANFERLNEQFLVFNLACDASWFYFICRCKRLLCFFVYFREINSQNNFLEKNYKKEDAL